MTLHDDKFSNGVWSEALASANGPAGANGTVARDTAAQHMVRHVPVARAEEAVAGVLARLPNHAYENTDAVYVRDIHKRLKGFVPLTRLFRAKGPERIADLMDSSPPCVHPEDDQEKIALVASKHGVPSVAVIGTKGDFLGVVPASALIEILRREHVEDMHRLAGILAEHTVAYKAVEGSLFTRLRSRLPWLFVGLLGSFVATLAMAQFEHVMKARLAVAFFIPAIIYLADAIGTQTEAIVVRYLSIGHAPLGRLLAGELATGALISLCLGVFIFPAVLLGFSDFYLALAVTIAVVVAGACAAGLGLLLPWLLSWCGIDPAFGSGPVATIIQDVLSIIIYFGVVMLLVAL